jgi:hypothetical protein
MYVALIRKTVAVLHLLLETVLLLYDQLQLKRQPSWSYSRLDLQLPMRSVHITTNVVSSTPVQARSIQYNIL